MARVVIADDHAIFRQGLRELLSGEPSIDVLGTASNGAEALSVVNSLKPDILILDISMPIIDGYEVARLIRQQDLPMKILMLSMHKEPASVKKALAVGADGYILKEDAFDDLVSAIKAVTAGKKFISSSAGKQLDTPDSDEAEDRLSPREKEIVTLIAEGKSTKEIAAFLGISAKTVETHRQRIMDKLGCHKATEIVLYAVSHGMTKK
jgi:two-component system nitrate/nitrite response regulator NarL